MHKKIGNTRRKNLHLKQFIFWIFITELLLSTAIIFFILFNNTQEQITQKILRIRSDIQYAHGNWNMKEYNSDPLILGSYPLYFITTDGFVLDRRSPIHGFLDTSNFKQLLTYQNITTATTITNQSRRIYSKPILFQNDVIGVVTVSYFNPQKGINGTVDKELTATLNVIYSKVKVKNGKIDVTAIDERQVPYNISFTVIDKYNTILKRTTNDNGINRIPNFIDPSYIKMFLSYPQTKMVQDNQNGSLYLIKTDVLKDKQGQPLALLAIGQSLFPISNLLLQYVIWNGSIGLVFLFISYLIFLYFQKKAIEEIKNNPPSKINFDDTLGYLFVNDKRIEIPYATNQFYLLRALFSKPSKRWETDEILKMFGEDYADKSNRKVYDASVKINKKVLSILPIKLILNQNKTYRLNPTLLISKDTISHIWTD